MKNKKITLSRLPIGVSWGLAVYAVTTLLLVVFAQIVAIPFTHALVLLCLSMPIPSIVCLLITMPFVSAGARVGSTAVTRNEPGTVCVNINNRSVLPISAADVVCRVPDQNGGRTITKRNKKISLTPFSSVTVETKPIVLRRGRFEVGVGEVWLYDLLHLIRIRKRINGIYTLAVLPKLIGRENELPDDGKTENNDSTAVDIFSSYDHGDVREYRIGDSMKRIHWKLSAKSDELQVRKSVAHNDGYTCVVCDRSVDGTLYRLDYGVRNELDDRTVEEAMLAVSEICQRDGHGCLSIGTDDGGALLLPFGGIADEGNMRYLLSGLEKGGGADITSFIPESSTSVYYILSYLSPEQAKGVFDAHKYCVSQVFNVCVRDVSAFIPEKKREDYRTSLEAFKSLLGENGISFFTVTEGGAEHEE